MRLWNAKTGEELKRIEYPGAVRQVLISVDGARLFAEWESRDPSRVGVTLSDTKSGRKILERPAWGEIVGFTPDGKQFLLVDDKGKPESLWDAETGKSLRQYNK